MDAATLQSRIYRGYGKAAARLGQLYQVARPLAASAPLGNIEFSLLCSFNNRDWTYIKPDRYGDPTWYGLFDASNTQAGDYLLGPQGPYFIANQLLHVSILCVSCNRSVVLLRPPAPTSDTGVQGYGGQCLAEDGVALGSVDANGAVANGWPACIILSGRADAAGPLPMSMKNAGWQILLPASVPLVIGSSDILLDDLGRRYVVEAAELTDNGWRINAKEAHA